MTVDLKKPLRPARNKRTVFPWNMWRWTGPDEDLFTLTEQELLIFETLVDEASKAESWELPAWSQKELYMESA